MTVQARRRTRDRARIDAPIDAPRRNEQPQHEKHQQPAPPPVHAHAQGSTLVPDVKAGLVVFLVAVPLCLGVALASGAPMLSGIVTGVVGGLLVSWLSGSQLMVSGPAAGLTAIVLAAITQLGSFPAFLTAVVLAGLLQIGLRFLRAGIIAYYFPSSVIKGMLAAIGLILILKQIPYALGIGTEVFESSAFAVNGGNTFSVVGDAIRAVHPGVALLSAVSMLLLVLWDRPLLARAKKLLPGPLAVVLLGVGMSALLAALAPSLAVPAGALVTLPVPDSVGDLAGYLTFPDWSALANPAVYTVALTLAIVASIETLLSLEATDKLDPYKRTASADRELLAQGIGNTICGLIGGLPMTGVIVRSSANIQAGGRTRMASFFHGVFLLVAVIAAPRLLNMIPLATLAAVLVYTGFKLAHPRLFVSAWRAGTKQVAPFVVTVVAILLTDLLVGIAIGLTVGAFFILLNNYRTSYSYHRDESADHHRVDIRLSEDVSFLNKASIRRMLHELPDDAVVTIDGSASTHVDADVVEIIHDFRETAECKGITLRLVAIPAPLAAAAHH
jgi:MFS superfamily sulfate permease-like transporter